MTSDVSLMHWPSGIGPVFWVDSLGITYVSTPTVALWSSTAGELSSELVLVSAHRKTWSELSVASLKTASELRKYSVPPLPWAKSLVPGDCAGQMVKAFSAKPSTKVRLMLTLAEPAASWLFESE